MTSRAKKVVIALSVVLGVCVLFVFGVLTAAAIMGFNAATRAGNEAATVQNLKTIAAVEIQYFHTNNRTYGTLDQLISKQFLSSKFAGHPTVADGYVFTLSITGKPDGASWYKLTADPNNKSEGTSHFYLDSVNDGIRVNSVRQAGPDDPPI